MHWLNKDLAKQPLGEAGAGVFATAPVAAGELLCVWGGRACTLKELDEVGELRRTHAIQVERDCFLVPDEPLHPADYFNHSCKPNAGLSSSITLVAMRDIDAGEQVCFDYAMSDAAAYDEFACACGAASCRGVVTADDWQDPSLQRAYEGYFSPYLRRAIAELRQPASQ